MPRRVRNQTLAAFYRGRPCLVCGSTDDSVAGDHIKTFGSGGECCHENMWPLCFRHHDEKGRAGLQTFIKKYADRLVPILESKGWIYDDFTEKWIRVSREGWED